MTRQSYEALYGRHAREVWAVAFARTRDADLATDIAQEAFLRLWKHGGDDFENPRAWLVRVARNLAEDHSKSAFRKHGTAAPDHLNGIPHRADGPPELLERAETFARVRQLLEELTPADREVLTLKYAFDYSAEEIAETLDANAAAVHMRLSRARQRLGELLKAHGVTTTP